MEIKRIYEAMFLVDVKLADQWEQVEQTVGRLMDRAEAEILYCKKWDERRLAYDIEDRRRGVYVLTFFKSSPERIVGLERDVQLTDGVLRVLVLKEEKLTEEKIRELAEGEGIVPVKILPFYAKYGAESPRARAETADKPRAAAEPKSVETVVKTAEAEETKEAKETAESVTEQQSEPGSGTE